MSGETFVAMVLALGIAAASGSVYRSRNTMRHNRPQSSASIPAFKPVYTLIRVTAIPAALGAYLTDWPIWMEVHENEFLVVLGVLIAGLGFLFFLWAINTLGDQYSPCFEAVQPDRVVTSGPYRFMDHPIYVGNVVLLTGFFLSTGSLWLLSDLLILSGFYYVAARRESHELAARDPRSPPSSF